MYVKVDGDVVPVHGIVILDPATGHPAGSPIDVLARAGAYVLDPTTGVPVPVVGSGGSGTTPVITIAVQMLPVGASPTVVQTGTLTAPIYTLGIPGSNVPTFTQLLDTSATQWTVSHMLGRIPNVQVTDSAGNVIYVNITHTDANTTVLSYNAAFVGKATFS